MKKPRPALDPNEFREVPGTNGRYRINIAGVMYGPRKIAPLKLQQNHGYPAYRGSHGYTMLVHRIIMILWRPVEGMENLYVDHIDADKKNFRLDNLRWVTPRDNALFAADMGLNPRGEAHGCAKLTEDAVRYIRRNYRFKHKKSNAAELAAKFSVSKSAIQRAAKGLRWASVPKERSK